MEKELYEEGVFTIAIQYPVVKASEVRFRFIVNNSHAIEDIDHLVDILSKLGKKHGLIKGL
jgi:7-keto-8-aminopelargonate synthetase-like enzyme